MSVFRQCGTPPPRSRHCLPHPIEEHAMATPVIITVAITGAVPKKKDTPAVPVTPAEQIESTQQAFEAGASLAHIPVRKPDQKPGSGPPPYRRAPGGGGA